MRRKTATNKFPFRQPPPPIWLVVLRINVDLAIFQPYLDLEAGDNQSLKIQVARPGIEPRSSCSASQELNHSATTAPPPPYLNGNPPPPFAVRKVDAFVLLLKSIFYPSPWRWVLGLYWLLPGLRRKLFPSAMFIDMTSRVDARSYQGCVAILRGRFILVYVRTYVMSLSAWTARM